MTLDVAICTHGSDGLLRVASILRPPQEDVRYVVSWQAHDNADIPATIADRSDVVVYRTNTRGLSNNRNNALGHCHADIILIADNDVTFAPGAFCRIIETFEAYPDVDIATFVVRQNIERLLPERDTILSNPLPRGYYVCSVEIALRRSTAGSLLFCPELGLGAPLLHAGEDVMYLHTAIRRGLRCLFRPIEIGIHPHLSTGERQQTPQTLAAEGAVIALTRPATAFLRLPLKAWRLYRSGQAALWTALRHLTRGALMAPALLRRHPASLR